MNRRTALSIAAGISLVAGGPAPASTKPCRDKNGQVIQCPKVRKPSPRCKDAKGRFTACSTPAANASQSGASQSHQPAPGAANGSPHK